jgi:ApaG protein
MAESAPIELTGLRVTLDKLVYRHLSPEETEGREHAFIYFLSIHNDADVPVTIKGRKWVVTHDDGTQLVVEGDGVVGETPLILPGDKFSYNSWHALPTRTAVATGAFLGVDADGRRVFVRIPEFHMTTPR